MRGPFHGFRAAILAAAFLTAAASAHALSFTGTLSVQYAAADAPLVQISGGGVSLDGAGGAFTVPAASFAGSAPGELYLPGAPAIAGIGLSDLDSGLGAFDGSGGTMAVGGDLLHFFFQIGAGFEIPMPLTDVGVGGSSPFSTTVLGITWSGTVTGDTWTTGSIESVGTNDTLSISGFDTRALDGTGAIRFVTPFTVDLTIDNAGSIQQQALPGYAVLDLVFVPEPSTLVLFAAGTIGLGAIRRRGRASRS